MDFINYFLLCCNILTLLTLLPAGKPHHPKTGITENISPPTKPSASKVIHSPLESTDPLPLSRAPKETVSLKKHWDLICSRQDGQSQENVGKSWFQHVFVTTFPPESRNQVSEYNIFNKRLIICSWDRLWHILKSKGLHWHSCIRLHNWASGVLRYHGMVSWLCLARRLGTDDHSRMLSWDSGNN